METLVTLVGALIQAPRVPHAYFALCRNEQAREIAERFQHKQRLPFELTVLEEAGWASLLRAIFEPTPWLNDGLTIPFYARAMSEIIDAYLNDSHRLEYNALKHGMRASIGTASLEIGPPKKELDGPSIRLGARDSSNILTLKPIASLASGKKGVHHQVERVAVGWSLERTINDLRLLSGLIENVRSLMHLLLGSNRRKLKFARLDTSPNAQELYFSQRPELVSFVMCETLTPTDAQMLSAAQIKASFSRH